MNASPEKAKSAVLTVGRGRGFVVMHQGERVVVTGAHCLGDLPPCDGASYPENRTYPNLLGRLGENPTVWAQCLFADPIADIAVLGSPDNQERSGEGQEYEELVESARLLKIAEAPETGRAWLLSLAGEWFECTVEYMKRGDGQLWVSKPAQAIVGGMSGSPIISDDGKAIGVVCLGDADQLGGNDQYCSNNPRLVRDLPARFLRTTRIKLSSEALHALGVPRPLTGFDSA